MIEFQHRPAAHCENGVAANLLTYYGLPLSEPLAFGLGSGLFFSHMPFIHLNGMAVTSFRPLPGFIFKRVAKRLGVKVKRKWYYGNEEKAMADLDALLEKGIPVGLLVGVYYLPYFPPEYRFHFNAHNITVLGKNEDGTYTVSDPVVLTKVTISREDLKKVRFAKGTYPPMGRMYWVVDAPKQLPDLKLIIEKSIRVNCQQMLRIPVSFFGVKGIRYLAKQLLRWEKKMEPRKAAMNLAQLVRMLEEIGTGGAGFRYMYAAFLQECAKIFDNRQFDELSVRLTEVGDRWRNFALLASRVFKRRGEDDITYRQLSNRLLEIADSEQTIFKELDKLVKK